MTAIAWTTEPLGEDGLLLRLGSSIDAATNQQVHALAAHIGRLRPEWLREIVPAYATLGLFIDPEHVQARGRSASELLAPLLARLDPTNAASVPAPLLPVAQIPVCYEGECAPDLAEMARYLELDEGTLVARHCAALYTVAMIGFAPGFPYLLGMDPTLATPRKASPRTVVPAGSVAIGGSQTGIYPSQSPGGWQLIGRTPIRLFAPDRTPPTLLCPGQPVRFVPISLRDYHHACAGAADA